MLIFLRPRDDLQEEDLFNLPEEQRLLGEDESPFREEFVREELAALLHDDDNRLFADVDS